MYSEGLVKTALTIYSEGINNRIMRQMRLTSFPGQTHICELVSCQCVLFAAAP